MLNTIKQMKGVFNFNMYFAGPETRSSVSEAQKPKEKSLLEVLSLQQIDNLEAEMYGRKQEILKFVKEISLKDTNNGNISLEGLEKAGYKDQEQARKIFKNLLEMANLLNVSASKDSIPYEPFKTALEKFNKEEAKGIITEDTKRQVKDVKTGSKVENKPKNEKLQGINEEVVKNFDLTKDFSDKIKIVALQKALGIKNDGYFGPKTVNALKPAKILVNQEISMLNPKDFKENDKKDSGKVALLQYSLVLGGANLIVDGRFGPKTAEALKKALLGKKSEVNAKGKSPEKNLSKNNKTEKTEASKTSQKPKERPEFDSAKLNVVDSQFGDAETRKNEVFLAEEKVDFDTTRKQVEKTGKSLDDLSSMLQVTSELNGRLEKFLYRDRSGYSIEALVRRIFSGDKYNEIVKNKEKFSQIMQDPQAKVKINQAMNFLIPPRDTREYEDNSRRFANETLTSKVMKFVPWVFGIYLGDIPLPIMKEMLPGADVAKSQSFMDWIDKGLPGSFEDYYKQNKIEAKPIKEFVSLKDLLSRTELTSDEQAKILSGDLTGIDEKTKNLLLTYLEVNLIPNLKILRDGAFNAAEQGKWYTLGGFFGLAVDKKSKELNKIIKGLEEAVKNKNLSIQGVDKAFDLLSQEANQKYSFVKPAEFGQDTLDKVSAGHTYAERIAGKNREVQLRFNSLASLNDKDIFNDYNRLFALKNLNDFEKFGVKENDKQAIAELLALILKGGVNKQDILAWQNANKSAHEFIKSLGDKTAMQRYLINSIPKSENLKYVNVGPGNIQDSSHGRDLSKYSNQEALNIAESETPEKNSNLSTLGLAYKSFIEKGDLAGISYNDFRDAFANKTNIPVSEMTSGSVINTGRNKNQGKLTNFSELAKQRGDTHVFKLAPIEKSYTFYEKGQEVTINASYNLYMRQDCTNPILVPNTVKVTKEGREVPEGEFASLMQVKGKLPIVIPWFLFAKKPPTPSTEIKTTPGHTVNGDVVGSGLTGSGNSTTYSNVLGEIR